jgi:putative tryptophan/tyrosine transport system substrate-binding protein
MKRREFMTLLAGATALLALLLGAARAEQKGAVRLVGVIMSGAESDAESRARIAAFQTGLEGLGWKNGKNIRIEYRWGAATPDLIELHAKEMVGLAPAVILSGSTQASAALQKLTTSVPIVCALVNDPVGLGFVKSLSHPGGNITGFTFIDPELIGKWLEVLKTATPSLKRGALLFNPATAPFYRTFLSDIEAAHRPAPLDLVATPVGSIDEMEKAILDLGHSPGGGLIIGPDPFNIIHIQRIAELAASNRLSALSVYRQFAVAGGLMSYGPDTADIFRRSAAYVDRILKGASPADLPVQAPEKFDFVINASSAKALGLTLPPNMLALADEVIE